MNKRNILLSLLALFTFSINSVYALEVSSGWTEYENDSIAIEVDKLKEFEEKLATRVNDLNRLNLDKVYRYSIEVTNDENLDDYMEVSNDMAFETEEEALEWANDNEPKNEGWSFIENIVKAFKLDKLFDLTRFETEEDAINAKNEFESNVDEDSANITIDEVRDETGDVTVNVENTYKYDTFENAYNASLELIDNNHDYMIIVSVVKEEPEYVKTETLTLNSIFDTKEEALNYISNLESNGYIVNYEIKEVNELSTLDEVYETIEEANKALEEFLEQYPETNVSNINEVRDETGDVTTSIDNDYKFDNVKEANEIAENLKENNHYYLIEVSVVQKEPEYIETITEDFIVSFKTEKEALNYINNLESNGYTVNYEIKEVNELSTLDEVYETIEEANKALEEFLEQYPETNISNINEVRDETGDVTVKVENTYKYYTFEGAFNAAEGLRTNNHDYIVEVNVISGNPELESTDTLTLNSIFNTKEEALNYITSLENDGYTVTANIKEVNEISTLNQTYDTREEAEVAIETFKNECQSLTSSNIEKVRDEEEDTSTTTTGTTEYETREEAEAVAEDLNVKADGYEVVANIREESKNIVVGPTNVESEQFNSQAEAQTYIDNLKAQGYDVSNLKIELVPFEESIWGDEDNVIVNPGTGSSTSFTYGHFDVTLLTSFTKIDATGNKTTVTGVVTINSVKINNKNVVMEGPSVDRNTGLTEYTSEERRDLKVTNNSLVEVTGTVAYYTDANKKTLSTPLPFTIDGYLTESQNVCGGTLGRDKGFDLEFESITIVNNKVIVDSNVVNKYKVTGTITKTETKTTYYVDTTTITYGYDYKATAEGIKLVGYSVNGSAIKNTYKDVYLLDINKTLKDYDYNVYAEGIKFIEYLVNGTKKLDIYKDVYTLDINKTIKDYDYRVTADGVKIIGHQVNGTATKDIYKDVYTLDINKIIKDYDYEVSGNGIKTYYDVISKYVRLTDVNYLIEYMELGKGGDVEELPPQTGVNSNIFEIINALLISLFILVKKYI